MSKKYPYLTIFLSLVAAFLGIVDLNAPLQWDRLEVIGGEWWRVASGHFVHWNFNHLVWDLAIFAFLGSWLERMDRKRFATTVVLSVVVIGVWLQLPGCGFDTYRGLSGIDAALFAALSAQLFIRSKRSGDTLSCVGILVTSGLFATKIAFEAASGRPFFVSDLGQGVTVAFGAHLLGFIIGLAAGIGLPHSKLAKSIGRHGLDRFAQ